MSIAAEATRFNKNCSSRIFFPCLISRLSTVIPNPSTAYCKTCFFYGLLGIEEKWIPTLEVSCAWRASFGCTSDKEFDWRSPTVRLARLAASPRITPMSPLFTAFCSCFRCPPANWRPIQVKKNYANDSTAEQSLWCTCQSDKKTKNVICSFENTEDP